MAKRNTSKKSSNNNDIKVTATIVILLLLGIGAFLFFNQQASKPTPKKTPVVVKKTIPAVKAKPAVKPIAPPATVKKTTKPLIPVVPGSAGKIAFIIDDWGQSTMNCKYLKEIKDPITVAILPSLRHSDDVAACAKAANKEIILHLPLQAYHNNDPYPTDYIIKTDMKAVKVEKLLNDILLKMPYIEGVNNHMGSKATEDERLMTIILRRLKKKNLYFVDSMTAPNHSVVKEIATTLKLPYARRDVFLDNVNTRDAITRQFKSVIEKARSKGSAIVIGHDRTLTMQVLKEQILWLKEQGFEIVSTKELLVTP